MELVTLYHIYFSD